MKKKVNVPRRLCRLVAYGSMVREYCASAQLVLGAGEDIHSLIEPGSDFESLDFFS